MNTVQPPPGGPIRKSLAPLAAQGADAAQVADAAVAVWKAIHGALTPVIGPRGSAALYHRTLHVAREQYPWLAAAYEGTLQPGDFATLRAALAQQPAVDAAAAQDGILHAFLDLLAALIGEALTERLLQGVWPPSSGEPAATDTSP
jgi:hypothetical protein